MSQRTFFEKVLLGLLLAQGAPLTVYVTFDILAHVSSDTLSTLYVISSDGSGGLERTFMVNAIGGVFSFLAAMFLLVKKRIPAITILTFSVLAESGLVVWYFFLRWGDSLLSISVLNYIVALSCIVLQVVVLAFLLKPS